MDARARLLGVVLLLGWVLPMSRGMAATHQRWDRRPGVILYHIKNNASPAERTALGQLLTVHQISAVSGVQAAKSHQALTFPGSIGDEESMAEELKASGAVDFAEPDFLMPAASIIPNDPQYGSQWYHQTINSPMAWSYTTGSTSVVVAVCDTGIDASHPDLAANLSLPGFNVVDQSTNTDPVAAHGTEVAGVIGAVGNNALGVAGMDWSVKILPVRITDNPDSAAWCSDMANGIEWAADHGAKVINLSYETMGCPATINAASQYAQSQGALVFIAAGNEAQDVSNIYPTPHAFVLVGATDASDQQAVFSNYGSAVSLGAPGVSILTVQPGGSYGMASGTSFSAPLAAGVAALIFSLNTSWTPNIVENLILASAKPLGSIPLGYGRIDAGAALAAAQNCLAGNCVIPAPLGDDPPPLSPPASVTTTDVSSVRAYPNPWKSDRHQGIPMTLDHLAPSSDVKIFTVSAQHVRRLSTDTTGTTTWDLTNDSGERVASGIYLFLATDSSGQSAHGKLAVIR